MRDNYFNRTLANRIVRISKRFKTLLLTGPRQVGKTTLLKHVAEKERKYVSLDNVPDLLFAKQDPKGFLATYSPPVLIDEIQYAPELFSHIKIMVDASDKRGSVWMTGSQQYDMMKGVTESLAGRVAILDLLSPSLYERSGAGEKQMPFLPSASPPRHLRARNMTDTFKVIWQGAFPEVLGMDAFDRRLFYDSYVRTYLERDVRKLVNVGNEIAFVTFLKVVAARTGQELNYDDIARNVGIAPSTVKSWISILGASGLIFLLQPYFKNITKRLTKTPKLFWTDTGLAAHLAGWTTSEALENGISAGAFFETFVVSEVLKSYWHNAEIPDLYFYRDEKGHEIDLLISRNGKYFPVEIKKHATPSNNDISAFKLFEKHEALGEGVEICLTSTPHPLSKSAPAISLWDI